MFHVVLPPPNGSKYLAGRDEFSPIYLMYNDDKVEEEEQDGEERQIVGSSLC
jgi:hypothetical protein